MKYAKFKDKYAAQGWAHAQSLRNGGAKLYLDGVKIKDDGSVEVDDEAALKIADKLSDDKTKPEELKIKAKAK